MPLITFTGLPCSGKTTWAEKLIKGLEDKIQQAKDNNQPGHNYNIVHHSDDLLGIDRNRYRDSTTEKLDRGSQISAVRRDLSRTTFVILDSLCYIKGFRYQLFCEAKGMLTPHCVVHVINSQQQLQQWNQLDGKWPNDLIEQLSMRYEEPVDSNRWDSPLFSLVTSLESETIPIDEIWDVLVLKKPPPPNNATLVKPTSGNNFMQELEAQTQLVITKVLNYQQLNGVNGRAVIDHDLQLYIDLPTTNVSISQLQRIRRTYIGLNRMRSVQPDRIQPMFVDYVNRHINSD